VVIHRWSETLEFISVGKILIVLSRSSANIAHVKRRFSEQLWECLSEETELVLVHSRGSGC
jgi:hypothetical protein